MENRLYNNQTEEEIRRLMPAEYRVDMKDKNMSVDEIQQRTKLQIEFRKSYHKRLKDEKTD